MGRIFNIFKTLVVILVCLPMIVQSAVPPGDQVEQIRAFTRNIEFDYVNWELNAIWQKIGQVALGLTDYLDETQQHQIVTNYISLLRKADNLNAQITQEYSDPQICARNWPK